PTLVAHCRAGRGPPRPASYPWAMAVAWAERFSIGESVERERLQFRDAVAAGDELRDQFASAGHLEAVVAVGDHVHVGRDPVEDRHVVGRERANAAVAALAKVLAGAFEPRHQLS